ncbi:glycosyltransferase family 2 protein [Pseudoalteromonas phenolica]|uniref:glycosyltransferase family 2 protein n=1 Tax=Pseudoalteromonas phenolica TaxID=161398 RepID=UPI00110AFF7A|nr:glycosyltransferase family 2 protein [Pseudoalteromonas phenolica]TMO55194.1 glycosyl transferase family 2 [Pseudoalteromonas phenolica]
MAIYISIVSHNHGKLISSLNLLPKLTKDFKVVVKNNFQDETLVRFCKDNNISLIDEPELYNIGFGENNNIVYDWCKRNLSLQDEDYFLVLNPDVMVDNDVICELENFMSKYNHQLCSINLFTDKEYKVFDNSIRRFPNLFDFFSSFCLGINNTIIDKALCNSPIKVDWAAGSFLMFSAKHYDRLNGFDKNYFMYCEDLDICWRSAKFFNVKVVYCPMFKAIHFANHANRRMFSKHFIWHLKSVFRFLIRSASHMK